MKHIKTNPTQTILVIVIGLVLLFLISEWKWTIQAAFMLGLIGIFSTNLSKKIDFLWMKLAWVLSLIIPNILLSIIFYLMLTPLAFLTKLFGEKDPLKIKPQPSSLFRTVNKEYNKESFEKLW